MAEDKKPSKMSIEEEISRRRLEIEEKLKKSLRQEPEKQEDEKTELPIQLIGNEVVPQEQIEPDEIEEPEVKDQVESVEDEINELTKEEFPSPENGIQDITEDSNASSESEEISELNENIQSDKPDETALTDFDLHLFSNGTFYKVYEKFGAQLTDQGVRFTTWAPNAEAISVIGEFNGWREGQYEMQRMNDAGVWTLYIPGLNEGDAYKYSIRSNVDGQYRRKSDPYSFRSELRPKNASIVHNINKYSWNDDDWIRGRKNADFKNSPVNIYELHLGSWKRAYDNHEFPNEWGYLSYRQLAHEIVDYIKKTGYTHIELMPVMEHPLDISWGYQVTCYYAPSSRFGTPDDFMYFVDHCHKNGIGVLLDWVPAHFPSDEHSLAYFDGKQIYAYESWKKGFHKDWNTYIFDYGRHEVQNFLIGSALFWLENYHADGLRVDAVASMLYLDYSREQGEWEPNIHGGRENLEAISFLKHLNDIVHKYHPGTLMIAEESTAWPGVSHPVSEGGLGFDMKWNMGWMNDILLYFSKDPVYRKYHQGKVTFSLWYAFNENFVLPVSHDEVVHGKRSLLEKMPGDNWQKFANLRLFFGFMFGHPGKKLNFMTNDIAQYNEWNSEVSLEQNLLDLEMNKKFKKFAEDLFTLYRNHPSLYEIDFNSRGFHWVDFSDALSSVLSFYRIAENEDEILLFTFNMTPTVRNDYTVGVPKPGYWKEILNSDADIYGGSGIGNLGGRQSEPLRMKQWENSIKVTLPPLAVNVFKYSGITLDEKNAEIDVEDDIDKLYVETGGGD